MFLVTKLHTLCRHHLLFCYCPFSGPWSLPEYYIALTLSFWLGLVVVGDPNSSEVRTPLNMCVWHFPHHSRAKNVSLTNPDIPVNIPLTLCEPCHAIDTGVISKLGWSRGQMWELGRLGSNPSSAPALGSWTTFSWPFPLVPTSQELW